jgi:hypothetical protein
MQVYFDEQAGEYATAKKKSATRRFWRFVAWFVVAMIVLWWLANVGSPRPMYM